MDIGNVEMWKCGNVEMWKCGNVEMWKLISLPAVIAKKRPINKWLPYAEQGY
jgi:hypothetical protein